MNQKMLLKLLSSGLRKQFPAPDGTRLADRATALYHRCCQEHQQDPPALKKHTEGMIYAGVSLYWVLQENGLSPEDALALTDKIFQDFAQDAGVKIRGLLKLPGLYRKVPKLFRFAVQKKYPPEAGFQMTFYDMSSRRVKFDVTACPYYDTCAAMGCPELTAIFCNTDDACYGRMHPKLRWQRTETLGRGGTCCDFDLVVTD